MSELGVDRTYTFDLVCTFSVAALTLGCVTIADALTAATVATVVCKERYEDATTGRNLGDNLGLIWFLFEHNQRVENTAKGNWQG